MVLTLLGNNPVNVEDGWVLYDPITLQNNRTYLMEVEIFSSNPEFIYSSFQARFGYPTQNTPLASCVPTVKFFYEPVRQCFEFTISPNLAVAGSAFFAVRRFSFFSQPSNLADATIALAIDPDIFY